MTLVAVYTQPDRAVGRGQKVQPNAIKLWAQERGLPVHQPEKLTPEELTRLKSHQPDVALIMAYGHILRQDFIAAPRLGTLNLHTSLLPKYRGASPIQTAIASGERETGVTLMRIVPALDAGPVAGVERVSIGALDTALEVETKLAGAYASAARAGAAGTGGRQAPWRLQSRMRSKRPFAGSWKKPMACWISPRQRHSSRPASTDFFLAGLQRRRSTGSR